VHDELPEDHGADQRRRQLHRTSHGRQADPRLWIAPRFGGALGMSLELVGPVTDCQIDVGFGRRRRPH